MRTPSTSSTTCSGSVAASSAHVVVAEHRVHRREAPRSSSTSGTTTSPACSTRSARSSAAYTRVGQPPRSTPPDVGVGQTTSDRVVRVRSSSVMREEVLVHGGGVVGVGLAQPHEHEVELGHHVDALALEAVGVEQPPAPVGLGPPVRAVGEVLVGRAGRAAVVDPALGEQSLRRPTRRRAARAARSGRSRGRWRRRRTTRRTCRRRRTSASRVGHAERAEQPLLEPHAHAVLAAADRACRPRRTTMFERAARVVVRLGRTRLAARAGSWRRTRPCRPARRRRASSRRRAARRRRTRSTPRPTAGPDRICSRWSQVMARRGSSAADHAGTGGALVERQPAVERRGCRRRRAACSWPSTTRCAASRRSISSGSMPASSSNSLTNRRP